jgi:AraC family transcriptional regulator
VEAKPLPFAVLKLSHGFGRRFLGKIAVELERALAQRAANGAPAGRPMGRLLAHGNGWTVEDLICVSGPRDRVFEERHLNVSIAVVLAGSFQYRSQHLWRAGGELMTPGSLLLGNAGQHFECGHEHGAGDRCLSFRYSSDYFEKIAADAGAGVGKRAFPMLRVPALRELSPLVARAYARLVGTAGGRRDVADDASWDLSWEEIGVRLATRTVRVANGIARDSNSALPSAVARVTRAVRLIERHPDSEVGLASLAREAGLSPYHFLRTFERLTGATPHQYVLRARLREAAMRLATEPARVLDIALDCGFGDVSNFNHAFRAEFGVSPRIYRLRFGRRA